jgi:Tfp pilus assembly protein PilO
MKEKVTLTVALVILAILAGIVLIIVQAGLIRERGLAIQEEEQILEEARLHFRRLLEYRENAPHYREQLETYERMIPAAPNEEQIIYDLYDLADYCKMKVVEVRFDAREEEEEGYMRMPMRIILEGSYRNLLQLLKQLYEGQRALCIRDIRLAAGGDTSSGIRVNLSADSFYRKTEQW